MPPSYIVRQHFQLSSPLRPLGQTKPNFMWIEPLLVGGKKVCSNGQGHMTKMAAIPIYDKNLKISCFERLADVIETWYTALGTRVLPSLFK